jgi:hypothetical protein
MRAWCAPMGLEPYQVPDEFHMTKQFGGAAFRATSPFGTKGAHQRPRWNSGAWRNSLTLAQSVTT